MLAGVRSEGEMGVLTGLGQEAAPKADPATFGALEALGLLG